jgi:formylglycine-generating enzyme required for sulfatase activity
LLDAKRDALAVTSPDANQINVLDVSDPKAAREPLAYAPATLGPNAIVALDIGGDGNTPLDDLCAGSIYNTPEPNRLDLLRNSGRAAEPINDFELDGELQRANRITLKTGGPTDLVSWVRGDKDQALRVTSLAEGKPGTVLTGPPLPLTTEYLTGRWGGSSLATVLFYEPGKKGITAHAVQEQGANTYALGPATSFDTEEPVRQVFLAGEESQPQLVLLLGEGGKAVVCDFDGRSAPQPLQTIDAPPAEYWSGAISWPGQLVLFSRRQTVKFSSRYQWYARSGATYTGAAAADLSTLDETDVAIHQLILVTLKETSAAQMTVYTNTIPGTKITYVMLPIPGGEFLMGSPETEADRQADEGPQHKVKVEPFWMGRCEVTWDEYELFMYPDEERKFKDTIATDPTMDKVADAVARPTRPYTEMSFGMGRYGYPAISMTHHAANKYCQWLSAKTGHFYRLPTEAEWEYACRAGTTSAYSFGDDPAQLKDYGWFEDNSDFKYQKVGRKKPNPWGLHDIHGNAWEWCLDGYDDSYSKYAAPLVENPWNRATKPYPHVVRGGSYDDQAIRLRSAARRGSERAWKMQDPQLPKSIWWLSDAPWVGFRLVRPLRVPTPEELTKYWNSGTERD